MYSTAKTVYDLINPEKVATLLGIEFQEEVLLERIAKFIESADRTINSKLGGSYQLPITGAQSLLIIEGFSIHLAIGEIYALNSDGKMPEVIYDQVTETRNELKAYGGDKDVKPTKYLPDAQRRVVHLVANHED